MKGCIVPPIHKIYMWFNSGRYLQYGLPPGCSVLFPQLSRKWTMHYEIGRYIATLPIVGLHVIWLFIIYLQLIFIKFEDLWCFCYHFRTDSLFDWLTLLNLVSAFNINIPRNIMRHPDKTPLKLSGFSNFFATFPQINYQ